MSVYIGILLAALTACAFARPPGPTDESATIPEGFPNQADRTKMLHTRFIPRYMDYLDVPRLPYPNDHKHVNIDWLNKEIEKIVEMVDDPKALKAYRDDKDKRIWDTPYWMQRYAEDPLKVSEILNIKFSDFEPSDDSGTPIFSNAYDEKTEKLDLGPFDKIKIQISSDFKPSDGPEKLNIYEYYEDHKNEIYNPDPVNVMKISDSIDPTNKPEKPVVTSLLIEDFPKNDKENNSEVKQNDSKPVITEHKKNDESMITHEKGNVPTISSNTSGQSKAENMKTFAFTPVEKEFFENLNKETLISEVASQRDPLGKSIQHEGGNGGYKLSMLIAPRPIRQNPNLSKQKHLLEPDLGKLKSGFSFHDVENEHGYYMGPSRPVLVTEAAEPDDSVYTIALISAFIALAAMGSVGVALGWYSMLRKVKLAADVDYPAYGVTGPNIDNSCDRKLAHSAHMYHYQHQKQQIIAMKRNGAGMEQRPSSISDNDSEEENEEGDYTVYECPGFATTGAMEVKNPLFSEESTPATPGKFQIVKPQPKN